MAAKTVSLGALALPFFRHGSNMAMVLVMVALVAILFAQGQWSALWPWVAAGVAMFPVYEYAFHRFLLHAPPARTAWVQRLQRLAHYDHHEDTSRLDRLFTPIGAFFPLAGAQLALYLVLGANWPVASALLLGNMAGYLYYEWTHYLAHVPFAPRTRWGRYMKKYHLWHHHKNERYWFGVTSPLLDWLCGTYRPVASVPQSGNVHRPPGSPET